MIGSMFHKRCDKTIETLEDEVRYLRQRNQELEATLDAHLSVAPQAREESKGRVVYMDDARMVKAEQDAT
jgi:hypothetical protein